MRNRKTPRVFLQPNVNCDSAEKPGVDGEAAVAPLEKHVELSVFGRVSGPADRCAEIFQQDELLGRSGIS